jgi:hypothetical protein
MCLESLFYTFVWSGCIHIFLLLLQAYKVLGGKENFLVKDGKPFMLPESIILKTKELVALRLKQNPGTVTLDKVFARLMTLEENVKTILDMLKKNQAEA